VLLALALEAASEEQRREIRETLESSAPNAERLERLKSLFTDLGAFAKAKRMVEASRGKAQELADNVQPTRLRSLFQFLLETVLPAR
jgi:geranylgeranyl diphosphate synthase type II